MARSKHPINTRLLTKVSELYYLQDYNQQQIARRLHLSRPKVSRLLRQAREAGIVQISIVSNGHFVELESALEARYGLEEVVVVDTVSSADDGPLLKQQVGAAAAAYLQRTLEDGDVIGVTWGTTLQAMMQYLQPQSTRNVQVVQTLGGIGPPQAEAHAADLSRRLAQLLGSALTLLPAPGIVDKAESRRVLLTDRYVQAALALFPQLTVAYAGLGSIPTNPVFDPDVGLLSEAVYAELRAAEAVGDIALRFFDAEGRPVQTALDDRMIGITLEELRAIPRVVGIAGGRQKVAAIRGALRGGLLDVLITDHATASQLVEHEDTF